MDQTNNVFIGFLKYFGPSVDEGKIDIEKIGISLVALNRLYKKYAKSESERNVTLKLGSIQKKCTEVNICFEQITPILQPLVLPAGALMAAKVADYIGITELVNSFLGHLASSSH